MDGFLTLKFLRQLSVLQPLSVQLPTKLVLGFASVGTQNGVLGKGFRGGSQSRVRVNHLLKQVMQLHRVAASVRQASLADRVPLVTVLW